MSVEIGLFIELNLCQEIERRWARAVDALQRNEAAAKQRRRGLWSSSVDMIAVVTRLPIHIISYLFNTQIAHKSTHWKKYIKKFHRKF